MGSPAGPTRDGSVILHRQASSEPVRPNRTSSTHPNDTLQQSTTALSPSKDDIGLTPPKAPPRRKRQAHNLVPEGLRLRFDKPQQTEPYKPIVRHDHDTILIRLNAVFHALGYPHGIEKDGVCIALAQLGAQEAYLRDKGLQGAGFFEAMDAFMQDPIVSGIANQMPVDEDDIQNFLKAFPDGFKKLPAEAFGPKGSPRTQEQLLACLGDKSSQEAFRQYAEQHATWLANDLQFLLFPGHVFPLQEQMWFPGTDLKSVGYLAGFYSLKELTADLERLPIGTLCGISIPGHSMSAVRLQDGRWSYVDANRWPDPHPHEQPFEIFDTDALAHVILDPPTMQAQAAVVTLSPFMTSNDFKNQKIPITPFAIFHSDPDPDASSKPIPPMTVDFPTEAWGKLLHIQGKSIDNAALLKSILDHSDLNTVFASLAYVHPDHILSEALRDEPEAAHAMISLQNRALIFAEWVRRKDGVPQKFLTPEAAFQSLKNHEIETLHAYATQVSAMKPAWEIHMLEQFLPEESPIRAMFRNMGADARDHSKIGLTRDRQAQCAWFIMKQLGKTSEKFNPRDAHAAYAAIVPKLKAELHDDTIFNALGAYFPYPMP